MLYVTISVKFNQRLMIIGIMLLKKRLCSQKLLNLT